MKKHFVLYLHPPRPSFALDMSAEERAIMMAHVAYWHGLMDKGYVIAFGPVLDPAAVYGIGIIEVDHEEVVKQLIAEDPATGLNRYEYFEMKAVVRK